MNSHELMQRAENEAFGRLNREQEDKDKEEDRRCKTEDHASFLLNTMIDILKCDWDITKKQSIVVVEKVLAEIKRFHGVGG